MLKKLTFAALLGASLAAHAVTTVVLPSYPGIDAPGSVAGNSGSSAPGFGTGSWQQSGTSKTQVYFDATALFGHAVTVGDLQSISYWTKKPGDSTQPDWTLYIYTTPTGSGDSASWYHSRLNSEPYFTSGSALPGAPANTWNLWSTANGSNPLRFYDAPRTGHFGAYDDPTLAQLVAGSVTFDPTGTSVTHNYSGETVLYFSLGTGSSWANGFTGQVDGLTINTASQSVSLNLEAVAPVPEPDGYVMALLAALGVGYMSRRRTAKV